MSGKTAEKQQNLGKKSLNSEKKKKQQKHLDIAYANPIWSNVEFKVQVPQ